MKANDSTQAADAGISNPVPLYVERYGLSCAPFSARHEDRFVYLDAERLQRLNMLEHLTRYSELLLIISGSKGIGKTSLLQRFLLNTDEDTLVSQVNANPMMDANALLQAIASGFGLRGQDDDPAALQDALYRHIAALHHQQKIPLLLIDDAHVLPQDALETLFNLADAEASDGNLLRIILFSDPQIETMLQSPAIQGLRERITHSMSIPPFNEEQTVAYIRHRLQVAGLQDALPFSSKELHKIFRNSGGIPARINECAHLILNGDKLDQAVKDFHTPRLDFRPNLKFLRLNLPAGLGRVKLRHMALALAAVVLIGLVLAYQDNINALFEADNPSQKTVSIPLPVPEKPTPSVIASTPEPVPPETPSLEISALETPTTKPEQSPQTTETTDSETATATPAAISTEKTSPAARISAPEPAPETNKETIKPTAATAKPEPEPKSKSEPSQPATPAPTVAPSPPTAVIISAVTPKPVNSSAKPQTITILGKHFSKDMDVTVFWSGGHKTLSSKQVNIISPVKMELYISVGRKPDNWKVRLQDPLSKQKAEARFNVVATSTPKTGKAPHRSNRGLKDESWISKQNPAHFTLQLLGSRHKESLRTFIKRRGLQQAELAWFARLRNRQPWYTLIQGRYPNRAQAERAANTLAKKIPAIKPWIRHFADIQKLIRQPALTPPPAAISVISTAPPAASDKTTSAAWLWSQDPSHYTLQLLGGRTEAGILRFIQRHKLAGKAVYYRTTRNKRPWYILVYHSYPDYTRAKAAIAKLPDSLRKTRPWPRSFASIQAELQ
ncbi:hypothetical protein MNBD_GAMMA24-1572 [hydrothermal vent metagenome]|uniref:SPOR domain-containing protein n=1 Tax=hydrothermal vent metagenome TaxID=652676 RepID=A0A3B1C9R2_9ZZZZ